MFKRVLYGVFFLIFSVNGAWAGNVKVFFAPEDSCAREIEQCIDRAEETIDIAVYAFSSQRLAKALVKAKRRGVKIRVYFDGGTQQQRWSQDDFLDREGIQVKYEDDEGLMHNKFCIIDSEVLLTGSYNWSIAADTRNDENLMIIKSPKLCAIFAEKFDEFWEEAGYLDIFVEPDETQAKEDIERRAKPGTVLYVGHKGTKKFHTLDCRSGKTISDKNRVEFPSREEAIAQGYKPCKICKP